MQDNRDPFDDDERPLSGAAKREYLAVMRHAAVCDLKADADELAELCRDIMPRPDLLDGLSPDLRTSRTELLCLYLRERGMRRRLVELLAGPHDD